MLLPEEADIQIDCTLFDGAVSRTEADEYVQITNHSDSAQDMAGWAFQDEGDENQSFTFPGFILDSNRAIRVYTNEVHLEWGGFSFGRGSSIWNNTDPDAAILLDDAGNTVSRRTYDAYEPPGCQ